MSLNQVQYLGIDTVLPNYDLNVKSLDIFSQMYRRKSGENENGYVLQCYAPGRARFSAPPRFHSFQYALVGIIPDSNPTIIDDFIFTEDAKCIDTGGLITAVDDTITINKPGNYLVIYKVCRFNSACSVYTELLYDNGIITVPRMNSTAIFSESQVQDSSCYNAEILSFAMNDTIRLQRRIIGPEDTPPALVLEPNTSNNPAADAQSYPSYVMFLEIGV